MVEEGSASQALFLFFSLFYSLHMIIFREEEVSTCRDQLEEFRSTAGALSKWLEETNEKVPAAQPSSSKTLEKDLQIVSVSQEIYRLID